MSYTLTLDMPQNVVRFVERQATRHGTDFSALFVAFLREHFGFGESDDGKVSYWEDFRNKAALKIFGKRLSSCYNDEDIIESMSLSIHYANHLTSMLMDNKFKKE